MGTNKVKKEFEDAMEYARARSSLKIINEKSVTSPKVPHILYGKKTFSPLSINEEFEQEDL